MTLFELQRTMSESVMRRLMPDSGMRQKTADGKSMRAHAAAFIKPGRELSSFERLEIYNRQYWLRVLSVFADDFPGLRAALGQTRFDAMAVAYLEDNPSSSYTLRNLGSELVRWLPKNPKWAGKKYNLALDIARLEWSYTESFDLGERPPLTRLDLSRCTADSCLALQPHVRLLELSHPVDDFIIAVHRGHRESGVASNAARGNPKTTAQLMSAPKAVSTYLAVHRFEYSVYYKRLEREAYLALFALSTGKTLGDALTEAFEGSGIPESEQPQRVQDWFALWAELGWFCRYADSSRKQ